MTTEHTPGGLIGRSVRRVEDPVLITGKGCMPYTAPKLWEAIQAAPGTSKP